MEIKKVDMIVDLQYGSTGKGLIAGYLAHKNKYDLVINANMPNAGHTYIDDKGNKMMHKVLPNGIVSPECRFALIGPGSVFNIDTLHREVNQAQKFGYFLNGSVIIHPNATILTPKHAALEQKLSRIGSTRQGSMTAMVNKMERHIDKSCIARDNESMLTAGTLIEEDIFIVEHEEYNRLITDAKSILAEGAQGFSLGINQKFYPYCTSRECTPAQFMSDMGIPLPYLRKVIGTARTYPIRVGGTSGGCYDDQKETSWKELGLAKEFTTVTKRERRVFTFSEQQINDAIWAMAPDEIFINFCNYMDMEDCSTIAGAFKGLVKYTGHGPKRSDVHEV